MDAFILAIRILMKLNLLKAEEFISVPEISLDFSTIPDVLGTANFTNLLISGLETLESKIDNIVTSEDEDGYNHACVYVPVDYLKLTVDYTADIGVEDEIPIYGEGMFSMFMSDVEVTVCSFVSFDEYIDDVDIRLFFRHGPIELTGIWRNKEATALAVKYLNIFFRFYAMWSNYEPEYASCVISPIVQYAVNEYLEYENNTLKFNSTCLQEIIADLELHLNENDTEDHLLTMIEADNNDNLLQVVLDNKEHTTLGAINPVAQYIKRIINEDG